MLRKIPSEAIRNHLKRYEGRIQSVFRLVHIDVIKQAVLPENNLVRIVRKQAKHKEETMNEQNLNINLVTIELERRQTAIDIEVGKIVTNVQECACAGDSERARSMLEVLLRLADVRRVTNDALSLLKSGEPTPAYTVSSWFLHGCFQYLVQREVESLHFVTGVQFGNTFTLDKMVTFEMDSQTPVSARGDISSTHKSLMDMERYGHKLHACFHSHPGKGQAATFPSSVDLDYQSRLESGGYAAIGGIFSRDGYFRVFSLGRPFQIIIYGKGVERVDDRVYRLTEVDQVRC